MLPLFKSDRKPSKCQVSHGQLPAFVDLKHPPQKKKPFDALLSLKWCHAVDLILPAEVVDIVQLELLDSKRGEVRYAKVMMALSEIVEGEFFNQYVKKGDILMLSEGKPGVDFLFELREGILRLEIDKATYERVGLVGKPMRDGGLKHKPNRYAIEINLRLPSMLHGKKGFERIVWAFKNVLNQTLTWLFYDFASAGGGTGGSPIDTHHPLWITSQAKRRRLDGVRVPDLSTAVIEDSMRESRNDETYMADLEEWISLVALQSPRLQVQDTIDPFLCRYSLPVPPGKDIIDVHGTVSGTSTLRWQGFLPPHFITEMMLCARTAVRRPNSWAALQAHGFGGDCVSVLLLPGADAEAAETEFVCWQHPAVV